MPVKSLLIGVLLALSCHSSAAEPERHISAYVLPYYQSAPAGQSAAQPQVAVNRSVDDLLSANDPKAILSAERQIEQAPQLVSPMALMVLAIRLYDTGARERAAFWYYAASDRYTTLEAVLDTDSSPLVPFRHAMKAFAAVAGPVITGYAYCDLDRQQRIRADALQWVERNPYQLLFAPRMDARSGDRAANLRRIIARLHVRVSAEQHALAQPERVAQLRRARQETNADEKYCWRD
jgi:hypothetical protein